MGYHLVRRFWFDKKAVALVEFALIFPSLVFLAMLATDVFYFVRLNNDIQNVTALAVDGLVSQDDINSCDISGSYNLFNYAHRDRPFPNPIDENNNQMNIAIIELKEDAYDEEGNDEKVSGLKVLYSFSKGKMGEKSDFSPKGKVYTEANVPKEFSSILSELKRSSFLDGVTLKGIVVEAWTRYDPYWNFLVKLPDVVSSGPAFTVYRGSNLTSLGKTVTVETDATC